MEEVAVEPRCGTSRGDLKRAIRMRWFDVLAGRERGG